MSSAGSSTGRSVTSVADADPVTRNALRYTISAREYELLHKYLLSRTPIVKKRSPRPSKAGEGPNGEEDYNAETIRITLRLLLTSYTGLRAWEFFTERFMKKGVQQPKAKATLWNNTNLRLSLSISSILFFHRTLHRFFARLRDSLRTDEAKSFRKRNPRIASALTSKYAPAVGASIAGVFLGVSPADQTRITVTIYMMAKALEYSYNHLEDRGYFKHKPWWFGSWLMMPFAAGQLLHAAVFDPDCFPAGFGDFIFKRSPEYIQLRPEGYPAHLSYPNVRDVIDSVAQISKLKWPTFTSPILFPQAKTLPQSLTKIAPITDPAHPAIKHLSCAMLHPSDPSCLRTQLKYYMTAFPPMAKFITVIYSAFAVLKYKAFIAAPMTSLNSLAAKILRTSMFLTSAIGTAWGSVCFLQHVLPGKFLPTGRLFVSGFIAGLWAFLERSGGRSNFIYSARTSADSLWKVGKKHGWWRGIKNGDVLLFALSLTMINIVYERNPKAIDSGVIRKTLGVAKGEGWVDRIASKKAEKMSEQEDEKKSR